ncbi:LOW QUALITY PROTEIN: E3 ubiquitin-protein ligase RBBP6-like [Leptosomus discolor]
MSCIHYKFFAKLNYDTVTFNGLHISLCDLKHQIMGREKLKATRCDLQIANAETKEEYTDDNALIPKNSSVIVRRIPVGGVKATSKPFVTSQTEPASGTSKAIDDPSACTSLAQLIKTANLTEANASEEDKIKAMMIQSCRAYDPVNYVEKPLGPPPPSYICFRCGIPGHYRKDCPTKGDKNFQSVPRIKRSTGIPKSFLMEVEDPNTKGAMLTKTGKYAIPTINAEAYARGKKEKPSFLPEEPSSSSSNNPIPEELLCVICKDIMTDAAVIPCCGNSYCDECIRTALLESEEHTCPTCHQTDVSPDALVANKLLRQAVNNFNNGSGYTISSLLEEKVADQAANCKYSTEIQYGTTCNLLNGAGTPNLYNNWSKSPSSASPYSGRLYTCSKSRQGSSRTPSYSPSFSRSRCHSYSRSPPYPRRGKGKSRKYRSRSRSLPCRRSHSRSRSPVVRGRSPAKRAVPEGVGESEYFNRYREVLLYNMKAYYDRSVDFGDPLEKEQYREWERVYREWYEVCYKGCAVGAQSRPPVNRDRSPHRFGPSGTRRETLPYARGRKEDCPGGQSHRNRNRAGNYLKELLGRESRGIKDLVKTKEKEMESPLGDGKGNKHKKHQKRRKGDEDEGFPQVELLEGVRKPREQLQQKMLKRTLCSRSQAQFSSPC